MGVLIEGVWKKESNNVVNGKFQRWSSSFRNWITKDGSAGTGGFKAEAGRYHLYVSYACPWAHRTLVMRSLKNLQHVIDVSVVDSYMGDHGWTFSNTSESTGDQVNSFKYLYELYVLADSKYSGKVTVPVLWDKKSKKIVNNESSDIIKMFNSEFDHLAAGPSQNFYQPDMQPEIDRMFNFIYENINNGVYKAGFATTQSAYEEAYTALFSALDTLDSTLAKNRFLLGDKMTIADIALFPTLLRFDIVYYSLFKCNKYRIVDRPNLINYLKSIYNIPGIADTVKLDYTKRHYYTSLTSVNPHGIYPLGPDVNYI